MSIITCTRRLEFDAGHRVLRHESKCAHLHGHRYRADVTISATELDDLGRVVDFGAVKQLLGSWVDANWDHNMLLNSQDPLLRLLASQQDAQEIFAGKTPYIFPDMNPTAENIAKVLWNVALGLLPSSLWLENIRVYETPNCWADHRRVQ